MGNYLKSMGIGFERIKNMDDSFVEGVKIPEAEQKKYHKVTFSLAKEEKEKTNDLKEDKPKK
jgi:hypothetical protein